MAEISIHNRTRPLPTPLRARYCASFLCQFRGLMLRRSLRPDEGLLLVQKRETRSEAAIHMLFMFINLTVVWLDSSQRVVDVRLARRWRPAYIPRHPAQYVLELPENRLADFQIGDQLHLDETQLA